MRFLRFRLRTLITSVAILAILLGVIQNRILTQRSKVYWFMAKDCSELEEFTRLEIRHATKKIKFVDSFKYDFVKANEVVARYVRERKEYERLAKRPWERRPTKAELWNFDNFGKFRLGQLP